MEALKSSCRMIWGKTKLFAFPECHVHGNKGRETWLPGSSVLETGAEFEVLPDRLNQHFRPCFLLEKIKSVCLASSPHFLFLFHTYTAPPCPTALPLPASHPSSLFCSPSSFENFSDGVWMEVAEKTGSSSDVSQG